VAVQSHLHGLGLKLGGNDIRLDYGEHVFYIQFQYPVHPPHIQQDDALLQRASSDYPSRG